MRTLQMISQILLTKTRTPLKMFLKWENVGKNW